MRTGIDERVVAYIWSGKRFRGELRTTDGRKISVISPGQPQRAGPDFNDAELLIEAEAVRGDVEIHVNASDWYSHDHHADPLYNGVILHVVLWDDGVSLLIRKENGERVPTLELYDKLDSPLEEIAREFYGGEKRLPCDRASEKPDRVMRLLDELGWERLLEKADLIDEIASKEGFEQAIYERVMDALGFSANRGTFCRLARLERAEGLFGMDRIGIEARLFATSGLLPDPKEEMEDRTKRYVLALYGRLKGERLEGEKLSRTDWRFSGIRPANSPARRIAAAAYLLSINGEGFLTKPLQIMGRFTGGELSPRRAIAELRRNFIVPAAGYWMDHFDFGRGMSPGVNLVGPARASDIIVNVILPALYLWAAKVQNSTLSEVVSEIYSAYPKLQENYITRGFTDILGPIKPDGARKQQGLIFIYKTFCSAGSCDICPLAEGNL